MTQPGLRLVVALLLLRMAVGSLGAGAAVGVELFEQEVRPLLLDRCSKCHGTEKQKGGLRLDSPGAIARGGDSGPVFVAGDPDASLLVQAVRQSGELKMPPPEDAPRLAEAEVERLARWIRQGAELPADAGAASNRSRAGAGASAAPTPADSWWAFQPLRRPAIPSVRNNSWVRSPVDAFVLRKLESAGLRPSPPAPREVLLRRLYYDLLGLPPTAEEVADWMADQAPDAWERLIERLLASPRYGERWAQHWMDVVRYADTAGDNADYPVPEARLYRDYIIDAFNRDKPYDEFVREQLAGDILARGSASRDPVEQIVATGFLALSRRYATAPFEFMHLTIEDAIETTGRAFLGLSLRCARCHDHKYDPVTMEDYYGVYGLFASTRFPYAGSEEFASKQLPRSGFVPLRTNATTAAAWQHYHARLDELRRQSAAFSNELAVAAPNPDAKKEVEKRFAPVRTELRVLEKFGGPFEIPVAYAVAEDQPVDQFIHRRGEPELRGPVVPRRAPEFLASGRQLRIPPGASGRLEFADWLVQDDHPLTARVLVNRIWQHHFGRGLAPTPSNLGRRSEPPSHPELLDFLAVSLIDSGWSIKFMHRLILCSAAWCQDSNPFADGSAGADSPASRARNSAQAADPNNRLLWRHERRRLDAESIRDSLLSAAGLLDESRPGRHPFPKFETWAWTQHNPFKAVYDSPHRSVYLMRQRIQRHPFLALFDAPDANVSTDVRTSATVPAQALYLLNDPFVRGAAEALAGRAVASSPDDTRRIQWLYATLASRSPTPREIERAKAYLDAVAEAVAGETGTTGPAGTEQWRSLARVMLIANEFFYVD